MVHYRVRLALPHDVLLAEHDGPMILMGFLGFQTGVLMEGFGYGGVKSLRSSQSKPSSIGFRNCHNNIAWAYSMHMAGWCWFFMLVESFTMLVRSLYGENICETQTSTVECSAL